MVKVIMAAPGSGKTKVIIDSVNAAAASQSGSVVCITQGNSLNLDISHAARLVYASEYNVANYAALLGFVAGMHAGNYDITEIFIDGLYKVACDDKKEDAEAFILKLDEFSAKHAVNFTVAMSSDAEASDILKKYM